MKKGDFFQFFFHAFPFNLSLVLVSSVLLVISFPRFDLGVLSWFSMVPLLLAIRDRSPLEAFILSGTCGAFFFLGVFNWILLIPHYKLLHHALLAVYLGSYFGVFGLVFSLISNRYGYQPALLTGPCIWIALEYIRSNFSFLSLPWGLLGHTQYRYALVIQIAAIVGTYGLSFIIVMVNAALAALIIYAFQSLRERRKHRTIPCMGKATLALILSAASIVAFTLIYGWWSAARGISGKAIKVSIVQGNIEQRKKWAPKYANEIMQTYSDLTQEAARHRPALIVWPETATPGAITQNPALLNELRRLAFKTQAHLILGSARYRKLEKAKNTEIKYMNSAFLISPEANLDRIQKYSKIRLFPFGEYLPYKQVFPWKLINVTTVNEYLPGNEFTVFKHPEFRFSVSICWENIFPELIRQFVRQGAAFVVNIANEARFGKTAAPYQLAAISVFRAVENRIYIVRCANTGISCIIDPCGKIVDRVRDAQGNDIFVAGVISGWIMPQQSKTIYTRFGDMPILALAAVTMMMAIFVCRKDRKI